MRGIARVLSAWIISAGACGTLALAGGVPPASARTIAAAGTRVPVIVFLKYQPPISARDGTVGLRQRGEAIEAAQAPYLAELRAMDATAVKSYRLVNAFAATVPASAARQLAASPGVAAVIPDSPIVGPTGDNAPGRAPGPARPGPRPKARGTTKRDARTAAVRGSRRVPAARPVSARPVSAVRRQSATCAPTPLLSPEGLPLTHTDSAAPGFATARSLGYTGAGVTVGFLADGLDPTNVNLLRDGRSVVTDYRDFSGDGISAPTGGSAAFLVANAIAGQGTHVYDTAGFSAQTPALACPIRIEGTAPGASLVALKVFSGNNVSSTSGYLQAIDYAVTVDRVNVLDESFGASPFPDVSSLNAVQRFNDMATAEGVTVVVASGDSGPFNTIGSPATDPDVLSVGASTDYRFYAQTGYAGAGVFGSGGVNDDISSLSSGGYTQSGGTVDMVAPGELSFASCTADLTRYADCVNFLGEASPVEEGGGTNQSASMVAGAVALVIQAYRKAHGDLTPTPAAVRQILLSTADDLGAPVTEQGSGLLDSLRAVELASWMPNCKPVGESLRISAGQLNAVARPGTKQSWTVTVTNTGASRQVVAAFGRTFGAPTVVAGGSVTLSDAKSAHFTNWAGVKTNYGALHFTVPAGEARLDASIAWPASPAVLRNLNGRVRLILIDPLGRFAAHSIPQGDSGYGSVQVLHPAPGRWTAVIFSDVSTVHGTTGKVLFGATVAKYAPWATVTPASLTLARGASANVTISTVVPAGAGDSSGELMLSDAFGKESIPVTLRGLIPATAPGGGTFSGVLTGGNGRAPGQGQVATYQFDVPPNEAGTLTRVEADLVLANDPANQVTAYLVAPGGQTMGYGSNYLTTGFTVGGVPVQTPQKQLSVFAARPIAGRWTLIVNFAAPVPGDELADAFTGRVRFDTIRVDRGSLPDSESTVLARGKAVSFPLRIKNNGASPEDVFADARLYSLTTYPLQPQNQVSNVPVPFPQTVNPPEWIVPAMTSSVQATAASTVPVMFSFGPFPGDPSVPSAPGTAASAVYPHGQLPTSITPGLWTAVPSQVGPYQAGGAPPATASMTMSATTRTFDTTVTATAGDFWRFAVQPLAATASYSLFVIAPGQTRTIVVTINPTAPAGTIVRGALFVNDFVESLQFLAGSTLHALPYKYKVG
jgi:hypothetical protein